MSSTRLHSRSARSQFILALAISLSLAIGAPTSAQIYRQDDLYQPVMPIPQDKPVHVDAEAALAFACRVLEYDCSGVEPPQVVYASIYLMYGAWGIYDYRFGESFVWLDWSQAPYMDRVVVQAVLVHETVHYLDHILKKIPLDSATSEMICQSEWNGWRAGNAYLLSNDRVELADFDWAKRYGCFGTGAVY